MSMFDNDQDPYETEAATVAAIAIASTEPDELEVDRLYTLVTPKGGEHHVIDTYRLGDEYRAQPRRATGAYTHGTVESFIRYVQRHHSADATTVWIDQINARVRAVLNDHAEDLPGWGDHNASVALVKTPEWTHWLKNDGQYLDQEAFAEHLQDGITEIVDPAAATMLEVAQTIQGKTKADWKTATRLDNGEVAFTYQEEIEAKAGRSGHLEIPQRMVLTIVPFYGEQPAVIEARLRYRIHQGNLKIGYKLERPHEIVLAVMRGVADRLSEQFGAVFAGAPRA